MNGKMKTVGTVTGMATMAAPYIRRLTNDQRSLFAWRELAKSAEHHRRDRRRAFMIGTALGTFAGFAIGAALSPHFRRMRAGEMAEETRERMMGKAREAQQKVSEAVQDVREEVDEGVRGAQATVTDTVQQVREKTQEVAHEARGPAKVEATTDYFKHVHYPAGKREVRSVAAANGAPQDMLDRIDQATDQTFRSSGDIYAALGVEGYKSLEEERREQSSAA